jgi:hypothetical protein
LLETAGGFFVSLVLVRVEIAQRLVFSAITDVWSPNARHFKSPTMDLWGPMPSVYRTHHRESLSCASDRAYT